MATKRKKKRKRGTSSPKKRGVMMGMRSGFKKTANAVVGSGDGAQEKKGSWVGTVVTIAIVAGAAAFFFYRFR